MHYHSVKHDDRTSSSSLTELGESNTMLPHTTRFSTKRVCARRRILLTVPLVALVVFAAIFFPVYLTHSNNNKSSSSSSQQSSATTSSAQSSAAAAAARTTPGAEWVQTVDFENLDDLRIDYYSSGQNNSNILTSGLPEDVWSSRSPSSERRRRRSDEADVTMVEVDAIVFKRTNKPLRREEVSSSSSSPTRTSTISTSTFTGQSTSTSLSYSETTTSTSTATPTSTQIPVEQGGSVLQIFYPKGSYTPSQLPVGGTQFYAETPFDLTLAQSVTFNYSVFFPAYYNFVLGGKLPGLYGGQEGCGGGNNAQDCWSSRMAWRANGTGELYAYLPQDKQNLTAMLQVPPYSYVNTNYGISLGRGALNYTRSGWTTISQTISLNTNQSNPNGIFDIKINGSQAIYYDQVYYPTNIKGILFSTFFGGSTKEWSTPMDQYSYFRGFSVRINSLL